MYGDAAGTVRCIDVPPFTPTTLYVLAKAEGMTANGITSAEFRIIVGNPDGYMFSYTNAESLLVLGDPLGAGASVAFPTCRTPASGVVFLGTVNVFNLGTGGFTELLVTRRDSPSNPSLGCAVLTRCDAQHSGACVTPPQDSLACISAKAEATPVTTSGGFPSFLNGSRFDEYRGYVGCEYVDCEEGYVYAAGWIDTKTVPQIVKGVAAWVGIQYTPSDVIPATGYIKQQYWRWAQAGWQQAPGNNASTAIMYTEYFNKDAVAGDTDGEHQHKKQIRSPAPTTPTSKAKYGVQKKPVLGFDTDQLVWIVNGFEIVQPGGDFATLFGEYMAMKAGQATVELLDEGDVVPGVENAELSFETVRVLKAGETGEPYAPAWNCQKNHGSGDIEDLGAGNFKVWR